MDNLETKGIVEFIKHLNSDNFSEAEKSIRSVIEEKIKSKMKKQMSKGKPDYLDLDKDGDKTESMKKAAKEAKAKKK